MITDFGEDMHCQFLEILRSLLDSYTLSGAHAQVAFLLIYSYVELLFFGLLSVMNGENASVYVMLFFEFILLFCDSVLKNYYFNLMALVLCACVCI